MAFGNPTPPRSSHLQPPEAATTAPGLLSPQYRALTLGMVALVALCAFEALAVATAMPAVAVALDGLSLYALAFGGTLAASVVGMVLSGQWSDARGPAGPLWNGVAWFVLGLLIAGLAQSMPILLLGRIVQGFGTGAISVALYVLVGQVYPAALRPRLFAAFSAGWVVPSLIGPTISGLIVEHAGWRWVFLAVPFLAVPASLMLRPGLRQLSSRSSGKPQSSRLGWALGASISACLLHIGGQLRDVVAVALIVVGIVGLLVCAVRLLPAGTLRAARGLPSVIALRGVAGAAFFGTEVFLPLLLAHERGLSPVWAGAVLSVGALGWFCGSWLQGNLGSGRSRTRLLQTGMSLMATGIMLVISTIAFALPTLAMVAGWILTGLGMGLVYPSLSLLTLSLSLPSQQGSNASALQLCDSLSIATVLALSGSVFAALLLRSPATAYLVSFSIPLLLALLGLVLAGRTGVAATA